MAARMPMMATVIMSSISVKPRRATWSRVVLRMGIRSRVCMSFAQDLPPRTPRRLVAAALGISLDARLGPRRVAAGLQLVFLVAGAIVHDGRRLGDADPAAPPAHRGGTRGQVL